MTSCCDVVLNEFTIQMLGLKKQNKITSISLRGIHECHANYKFTIFIHNISHKIHDLFEQILVENGQHQRKWLPFF